MRGFEDSVKPLPPRVAPLWIGRVCVDPPILQAPMAGLTNHAYRQVVHRFGGVGLTATEMVSARGLGHQRARGVELPERLWGVVDEPRPLAVQIWDNDPHRLADAAGFVVERFRPSVVDLNFGCPAPDVALKAQSGAYLLGDPDRIGRIVARVVAACGDTPVSAKIRLGPSPGALTATQVALAVEDAAGAAVTVHGRTTDQGYRGRADWEAIARVKQSVRRVAIVGNGDLRTAADVVEAFRRWPVDGVMIGRAAVGRPWLFRQAAAALRGEPAPPDPSPEEQRECLMEHYRLVVAQHGAERGTILMRRLACGYAHGLPGARALRARIGRVTTAAEFAAVVDRFFLGLSSDAPTSGRSIENVATDETRSCHDSA